MGYTKSTDDNGTVRYKLDGKLTKGAEVPEAAKTTLDTVDEGVAVDEGGNRVEEGNDTQTDTQTTDPGETRVHNTQPVERADEADSEVENPNDPNADVNDEDGEDEPEQPRAPRSNRLRRTRPGESEQDEEGMGFPRKNGKTVDIFDGKTPHTELVNIDGIMVPLSKESYDNKTNADIRKKLQDMGKLPK
jgi:hypothetical protein